MRFVCRFYILIVVFAESRERWRVHCTADFDETELLELSQNLNPLECLQVVEAMGAMIPIKRKYQGNRRRSLKDDFNNLLNTPKYCLIKLEEWNNNFPENLRPDGRSSMDMILKLLGRPDLAKYIRENRKPIKFTNPENQHGAGILELPEHRILRRNAPKNDKNSPAKRRKKKKEQKAKVNKETHPHMKRVPPNNPQHTANQANVGTQKVVVKKYCPISVLIITFSLLFIVILLGILLARQKNCARCCGTQRNWNWIKRGRNCFSDYWRWKSPERGCVCTIVEEKDRGCKNCCKCCVNKQNLNTDDRQNLLGFSRKECSSFTCGGKTKRKIKKRRKRLSPQSDKNYHDRKRRKDRKRGDRTSLRTRSPDREYRRGWT